MNIKVIIEVDILEGVDPYTAAESLFDILCEKASDDLIFSVNTFDVTGGSVMQFMDERAQDEYDDYKEREAEEHVLREEREGYGGEPPWPDDVPLIDEHGRSFVTRDWILVPPGPPFRGSLTADEMRAIDMTAELSKLMGRIVAHGPTRDADLSEITFIIHNLQARVMMQAAAHAYPDKFRRLGSFVGEMEQF